LGVMLRCELTASASASAKEGTSRESLGALCAAHGEVAYVDYTPGTEGGYVRFTAPAAAKTALAALNAAGGVASWRLLGAEEETEYREAVQTRKRQRDEGRENQVERGVVLHVAGLAGASATDREALGALCAAHGEVAYVDYTRGAAEGYVRFRAEAAATAALHALAPAGGEAAGGEAADGGAAGGTVWRRLEPSEEDAYRLAVRNKRQRTDGKGGKGKGGKGKGGKGGKGKGKGQGGGFSFGGRGRGRG